MCLWHFAPCIQYCIVEWVKDHYRYLFLRFSSLLHKPLVLSELCMCIKEKIEWMFPASLLCEIKDSSPTLECLSNAFYIGASCILLMRIIWTASPSQNFVLHFEMYIQPVRFIISPQPHQYLLCYPRLPMLPRAYRPAEGVERACNVYRGWNVNSN